MNSESENSSNAFVEVAINKMEKQDKKIQEIETLLQKQIAHNAEIKQLVNAIESLQEQLQQESIAEHKVSALNQQMDKLISKLNTAPIHEVVHHHHIPKIIWVIILLAVILCIVCAGWFYTGQKLDGFIANDTKYRALKLDTAIHPLQKYLDRLDSVYTVNPDLRENVLQKEQEYLDNFYRVQKALRLKEEARRLEKEVGKK
ncbi:hypothetical protein DC498_22040 [Terrimonas sp.]|uniref:hypothetical protein n=1 Tax=Terrimonas sp. TaxID=1914338 RepID=UPI000D50E1FC|nr:hypothetical protein [Terrimonas sp.]PVD50005.1 hypothetical protein DC498_22040 [Terrimonas sp.]